jgi:hypothetical protein
MINEQHDKALLDSKDQIWFDRYAVTFHDGVLSFEGAKRLWQFKGRQVQVFVTLPAGTFES